MTEPRKFVTPENAGVTITLPPAPEKKPKPSLTTTLGIVLADHILVVVAVIAFFAIGGMGFAAYAGSEAAHAQRGTLALTKSQGDQIVQLKNLNKQQNDLNKRLAKENSDRIASEAKLLCGGFVPISKIDTGIATSAIGISLLDWAKDGAETLKCPGRLPAK